MDLKVVSWLLPGLAGLFNCLFVDVNDVLIVTEQLQGLLADKLDQRLSDEEWEVGQSCCARFAADNQWYRARIVRHVDENRIEVGMACMA